MKKQKIKSIKNKIARLETKSGSAHDVAERLANGPACAKQKLYRLLCNIEGLYMALDALEGV